ncbi:MAG TPA: universal stress protein [Burkholderiales bacterium]|nr:universal stress protein [Burkholderiales bacterium]
MVQIRSVVAATDLSAPARRAVDRAARLARPAGASLTLVHAFNASLLDELRRWVDTGGDVEQSIVDDVRSRLDHLAGEIGARYQIAVNARTVTGRPVDEIARVGEELEADLIVTGTLGGGPFRSHLIGSTAERVVRKSARPVLMVRQLAHEPYRRALVAVDFSRWSTPSIAIATAVTPEAHFVLVHCVDVPFEGRMRLAGVSERAIEKYRMDARDEANRRLSALAAQSAVPNGRWTAIAPTGLDPWMQIVRQEQEQDCDLIVIGKHGRNAVEELLLGSTTNMVIAESSCDVLVSAYADAS